MSARTDRDALRPFAALIDPSTGSTDWFDTRTVGRLSDIADRYRDQKACARILKSGDRLVYEVHTVRSPELPGELCFDSVVIYPGLVGSECHMTRGHYHCGQAGELYLGLEGEGHVMMQTRTGDFNAIPIRPGIVVYTPSGWGHRTANTGDVPLRFFGAYPSLLCHDYATVEKTGFAKLVVRENGKVRIVENPRFILLS